MSRDEILPGLADRLEAAAGMLARQAVAEPGDPDSGRLLDLGVDLVQAAEIIRLHETVAVES